MKSWMWRSLKPVLAGMAAASLVIAGCSATGGGDDAPPQAQVSGRGGNNGVGAVNDGPGPGTGTNESSPTPNESETKVKQTVALFFADDELMQLYRVEREIEADRAEDLPMAALEAWMAGPEQEGLTNLMPPEVAVETLECRGGIASVSFSPEIRNANLGSSGEMMLLEQIALVLQQFGCNSTQILVQGKAEESLLGHVTTDEPIVAPDPEQYPYYEE